MSFIRTLVLLAILAGIFFFFRPQIMQFVSALRTDTKPVKASGGVMYKEFQQHDMYKDEKKYLDKLDQMQGK